MKVKELIERLRQLPPDADIYVESEDEAAAGHIAIDPITLSHDDPTVVGYMIYEDKQLDLPLEQK